jgi:hypothetical protein
VVSGAVDAAGISIDGLDRFPELLPTCSELRRPARLLLLASLEPSLDDFFLFGFAVAGGEKEGNEVKTFGEAAESSLLRRLPFEALEELVLLAPKGPVRLSI